MSSESRTNIPNSLNEHWMPFTSNKDFKKNPRLITEAKGVYLKTHHGKTQIDASSGLFCNPLGHGRKEITEAVTKQLETLDYAQPFQQGFGGSFELATKISKHTPGDLNKIFYNKLNNNFGITIKFINILLNDIIQITKKSYQNNEIICNIIQGINYIFEKYINLINFTLNNNKINYYNGNYLVKNDKLLFVSIYIFIKQII